MADDRQPLIVILGPTAVGKTSLSIELARRLNGEIVSADSRLVYRGMDIGTAKPNLAAREAVPHHLIDVADPDESWNLALFQRKAIEAMRAIHDLQKMPLLVGGTGQYIRAITDGWIIPELAPDDVMRTVLENWGKEISALGLHTRLAMLDPQAAGSIDPRNVRRTVRALEVILRTGKRFSDQRRQTDSPFKCYQIGLMRPRPELYARIDQRIDRMLADGFVEEVRALLEQGYHRDLPSMTAIGYAQIAAYLEDEISLADAVVEVKRLTRQFVRRQANWFKMDDPAINWFDMVPQTVDVIETAVRSFNTRVL